MSIHYDVKADIYDIAKTQPVNTDCILIDSNVWLWMTYSNAGHGAKNWRVALMSQYAAFVQKGIAANAKICCCGLSLPELAHTIEKTERAIYNSQNNCSIETKEYRHNISVERSHVVLEIQEAWAQVSSIAESLGLMVDDASTDTAIQLLQQVKVDGYDLFILESMRNHGVIQVLTDDGDFATVPGIQVFTANRNVIQAAAAQSKLCVR